MKLNDFLGIFIVLFICAASAAQVSAQHIEDQLHMKLLTVDGDRGGTADLYLSIRPGSGSVFMESQPLTKLDTQISTRFANRMACRYAEVDCSQYDFFYTIRADSSIVGGPSASAVIALITYSGLTDRAISEDVVMTGTINPGGVVGAVAGILQKIKAAKAEGYARIMVPKLASYNLTNHTEEVEGIEIIEVSTFEEVIHYALGEPLPAPVGEITPDPRYSEIMGRVSEKLCERTEDLNQSVQDIDPELKKDADNKTLFALGEMEKGNYYSAASLCFGANVILRELQLSNYSDGQLAAIQKNANTAIEDFDTKLYKRNLDSLPELETFSIVKERLIDAKDSLYEPERKKISVPLNVTENMSAILFDNMSVEGELSYKNIAYAIERYYSALAWSEFFELEGPEYNIDQERLREACLEKIGEAQSRLDYVELYIPGGLDNVQTEIDYASDDFGNGEFALCVFKASKAKADASVILSGLSITKEKISELIDVKHNVSAKVIQDQMDKGNFPILGYSYYEYANVLSEPQPLLALTFGEYAIELSDLDMYFPKTTNGQRHVSFDYIYLLVFLVGVGAGIILTVMVFAGISKYNSKHHSKSSKSDSSVKKAKNPTRKSIKKKRIKSH